MAEAAILYGLVAMFAQGIANTLLKGATEKLGVLPTVIARSGTSALALWAVFAFVRPEIVFSSELLVFAIAVSVLGYFPFFFFIVGLHKGKVGIITPIASGWIIVAAVVSFFLYGEPFTAGKIFALMFVIGGVILASIDLRDWSSLHTPSLRSGVPFALLAALIWGVVFPLFKIPSEYFGALFFACLIESMVFLTGFAHRILTRTPLPPKETVMNNWFPVVAAGVLTALFTLSVSLGYLTGEVSIVSALGGASIVISIILAGFVYKERLTRTQYMGAMLVLLGIVLASVT